MFKEWLLFSENSDIQKDEFKKIVSKYFPEAQFHPTRDGIGLWTNINYADRLIKLMWERGLPRLEKDPAKPNTYKPHPEFNTSHSNVYISVAANNPTSFFGGDDWGTANTLQRGSVDIVKNIKAMVNDISNVPGMTVEFLPNAQKKSAFFKKNMQNMGINRIPGSNYWARQKPG